MKKLILYSTSACHLCEMAESLVDELFRHSERDLENKIELVKLDVSSDELLFDRYGLRIPVVLVEGASEDLGWPFDRNKLEDYVLTNLT